MQRKGSRIRKNKKIIEAIFLKLIFIIKKRDIKLINIPKRPALLLNQRILRKIKTANIRKRVLFIILVFTKKRNIEIKKTNTKEGVKCE